MYMIPAATRGQSRELRNYIIFRVGNVLEDVHHVTLYLGRFSVEVNLHGLK